MLHRIYLALLFLPLALLSAPAQEKSVRPDINVPFKNPDVEGFLKKFEVESREIYTQRADIVKACKLKPGMAIADIGAGTGLLTRLFATEVGPKGKVYAVDIAKTFLDHIAKTAKEQKLDNITTVQCDQVSCKLPENSVDAVFICDTYHHFEFPQRTLATIHKALKPGGTLILIDFKRIEGVTSEKTMKHVRAGQEVFTAEVRDAGFKQLEEVKLLKENYFVRFEKKQQKADAVPKESVKLTLLSVKPLDLRDEKAKWVTFTFKIDNLSGQNLGIKSNCFSAFDGLTMQYLDQKGKVLHAERWTERCSPMFEAKEYLLKPGTNEGFINCRLSNEAFVRVQGFRITGNLPGSEYKHHLESNTTNLEKNP